jgi:peptide/nickel transport system substrate-binding protein
MGNLIPQKTLTPALSHRERGRRVVLSHRERERRLTLSQREREKYIHPYRYLLSFFCFVVCLGLSLAHAAPEEDGITPAFPAKAASEQRRERKELVIALRNIPADLNPLYATSPEAAFVNGFLRRPLTAFDPAWKLACILCTELPTVENGKAVQLPDGTLEVTFTLPRETRWGDGMPLTTRDVLFSWQALQSLPEALALRPWASEVGSIRAVDEQTFVVRWQRPRYDYNRLPDFPILPQHVESLAFRNTAVYRQQSRYAINPQDPGLIDGPYRLAVHTADQIVLMPNTNWYGKHKPWFQRIVINKINSFSAAQKALRQDAVDILPPGLSLPFEDMTLLRDSLTLPDSEMVSAPGTSYEHIDFNLDNPLFQDVRVRQALLLALNREALNIYGFEQRYEVAYSLVSAKDPVFGAAFLPQYDFDMRRAGELLDQAGWLQRQEDGYRYNAAGERLRFAFTTSVRHPVRGMIQQVARNFWRKLGVEIIIDNVDQETLIQRVLPERAFTGIVLYSWSQQPQEIPWFTLHSSAVPVPGNRVTGTGGLATGGLNFSGLRDDETDAALVALATETRAGAQQRLWLRLQQLYLEKLPGLPLYFRPVAGIVPKSLRGFSVYGHRSPASLWAEKWYLEAEDMSVPVKFPF